MKSELLSHTLRMNVYKAIRMLTCSDSQIISQGAAADVEIPAYRPCPGASNGPALNDAGATAIRCVGAGGYKLSLAELTLALKIPKTSLANLLRPLVAMGYLNFKSGGFQLGSSMFRLAGSIMSVWNFSDVMRPFLEELAARSGESVYLGVMDRAGKVITYVDAVDSPHSLRYSVPVGAVRPLYCTGAGRVLLAYEDQEWQDHYISTTELEARTARTVSTGKRLREELEQVRKTRISVSIGEMFAEASAIAAPIFAADGKIAAAIAVDGPTERIAHRIDELCPIIADVAARASSGDL